MIVVRLQGGLGNQMFQYAFGQYLAKSTSNEVRYDTSSYATDNLRHCAIESWRVKLPTIDMETFRLLPKRFGGKGYNNLWSAQLPLSKVREKKPYHYEERYLGKKNGYFVGYWQNERYFPGMREALLEEFQPANSIGSESRQVLKEIEASNSVALHVRRTDYLNLPEMQVCDLPYYHDGVERLLLTETGIKLFVFSDDLAWCRENLRFPCPIQFVGHNTSETAHEDLWLMSRCRHHIIPNSSFSWWAAWLKNDTSGRAFVPEIWFADPHHGGDEIAPERWDRLKTLGRRLVA